MGMARYKIAKSIAVFLVPLNLKTSIVRAAINIVLPPMNIMFIDPLNLST